MKNNFKKLLCAALVNGNDCGKYCIAYDGKCGNNTYF